MKGNINLICFLSLFICLKMFSQTPFDKGYKKGYKEGFCYQIYGCIAPIPPISPLPNINEKDGSFKDGYQRGFIDGRNVKDRKKSNVVKDVNQFKTANFGDYISPYDFNLIYKALEQKQRRYRSNSRELISFYNQKLKQVFDESELHYSMVVEFVDKYNGYILEFKGFEIALKDLNPRFILERYPNDVSLGQMKKMIDELKENNEYINAYIVKQANNLVSWFSDSPNNLIRGSFSLNNISDFEYDKKTREYKLVKNVRGESYVVINSNAIFYKRNDKKDFIACALRYSGIKSGLYVFEDGWGGVVGFDKNFNNIYIYYNKDIKTNQYLKKAIYHNIKKIKK